MTGNFSLILNSVRQKVWLLFSGNYVLYGTAPPYRGIAAFALECRSNHPISEDMLFLPFEHYVTQIAVKRLTKYLT